MSQNTEICQRCYAESRKTDFDEEIGYTYSAENDMIPGEVPECLEVLNQIEEAAIKKIKPFLHMYKRRGGNVGFSGNCISFAQNVESFATSLPHPVRDLPHLFQFLHLSLLSSLLLLI